MNTGPQTVRPAKQTDLKPDGVISEAPSVAAAEAADLQTHHLWLFCLEKTRRGQLRFAQGFVEDYVSAGQKLAGTRDPTMWLSVQADFLQKVLNLAQSTRAEVMDAWEQMQGTWLKDLNVNTESAVAGWTSGREKESSETTKPAPTAAPWLDNSLALWQVLSRGWMPPATHIPSPSKTEVRL